MAIVKKCERRGCLNVAESNNRYCKLHLDTDKRRYDTYRYLHKNDAERKKMNNFYCSDSWIKLRDHIRVKFFGMCVVCWGLGRSEYTDIVHHIVETSEDWDKRLKEDNCISVCASHHKHIHDEYKKSKLDKQNMQKMLFSLRSKFLNEYGKE